MSPSPFVFLPLDLGHHWRYRLSLYRFACSGNFIQIESYNMWSFVTGFIHIWFQGSSVLQHVSVLHSFLWLSTIALYGYTTFGFQFICQWISVNGYMGCFQFGVTVNYAATNMCEQVFVWTSFHLSWVIYLGVEMLGHMVTIFFINSTYFVLFLLQNTSFSKYSSSDIYKWYTDKEIQRPKKCSIS